MSKIFLEDIYFFKQNKCLDQKRQADVLHLHNDNSRGTKKVLSTSLCYLIVYIKYIIFGIVGLGSGAILIQTTLFTPWNIEVKRVKPFQANVPFLYPWKHLETKDFLFLGGGERGN